MNINIYNIKQLEAVANILAKGDLYFHRKVCRWFSKEYSTPLSEVEKMEWDYLLTHYYESMLENMPYNEVFDMAQSQFLEEFKDEEEELRRELDEKLLEEQKNAIAKKELKNQQPKPATDPVRKMEGKVQNLNMKFEDEFDD